MKSYISVLCSAILTACIVSFYLSDNSVIAYAAGSTKKSDISKGSCIAIMIVIFIISAAASGFITFKIKRKKSDISADKLPSDKDK